MNKVFQAVWMAFFGIAFLILSLIHVDTVRKRDALRAEVAVLKQDAARNVETVVRAWEHELTHPAAAAPCDSIETGPGGVFTVDEHGNCKHVSTSNDRLAEVRLSLKDQDVVHVIVPCGGGVRIPIDTLPRGN